MSLPILASPTDLSIRLGTDISDIGQAQALLLYASSLIRGYTGQDYLDADGDLIDPLPDGVSEVCVEIVARAVINPTGVTQQSAGPYSVSFGAEAAQRVYLSAQDKTILDGSAGGRPKLWTMPTTRGPIETELVHVPPSNGGRPWPVID